MKGHLGIETFEEKRELYRRFLVEVMKGHLGIETQEKRQTKEHCHLVEVMKGHLGIETYLKTDGCNLKSFMLR